MTTDDRTEPPELLTRAETAKRLRMSLTTVSRLIAEGTVRGVKIGHQVRVPRADLDRLIAGEPPLQPPSSPIATDDLGTWPPTPSMLATLDAEPADTQADDDARAVRDAERSMGEQS